MTAATIPTIQGLGAHTTADLKYYVPPADGSVPYYNNFPSTPQSNIREQFVNTVITDLRPLVDQGRVSETNVDITGFQVVVGDVAKTAMKYEDWDDEETIKSKYYAETAELLKKTTGASRVVFFDHTIRRQTPPKSAPIKDTPDSRQPVVRVHVDQTPESGRKRVLRHTGEDADRLLRGRAQLINVWRPLRGPVRDTPLAVADARTLNPARDLVKSRLIYEPPVPEGETYQVNYSTAHRWYYLSDMQPQEVLLLKCWEAGQDFGGVITPHTAFTDDRWKGVEGVVPRQSIEVRALVFHEPEGEERYEGDGYVYF